MAEEQHYEVKYDIRIDASDGVQQLITFAKAIEKIAAARKVLPTAVNGIKDTITKIDEIFGGKDKDKRKYEYTLTIGTDKTEERLGRVKTLLEEINLLTKNIKTSAILPGTSIPEKVKNQAQQVVNKKVVKEKKEEIVNPQAFSAAEKIKSQAKHVLNKEAEKVQEKEVEQLATTSVRSVITAQREITRSIGKINSALTVLERKREINIQTDAAKARLLELIRLLQTINSSTAAGGMAISAITPREGPYAAGSVYLPRNYVLPETAEKSLQKRLFTSDQIHRKRMEEAQEDFQLRLRQRTELKAIREKENAERKAIRDAERAREKTFADQQKAEEKRRKEQEAAARKAEREREKTALQTFRAAQRRQSEAFGLYKQKRQAAINRIQYSRMPSLRSLPFASMVNAYMGYSLMRSELTKAIDYSNIMESAHSILRVADGDLSTFEERFDLMARHVRRVGIETKYTAVEIAGAVKYLSMAGMNIDTIYQSIRPITNLALIGDNDVSYIADLATNIMAGYDIANDSMGSVADIIASTISRSNVNIVEVAESYKMAAGYLRMAGIDFTESAAAIGLLGNMGLKGTLAGTSLRALATRFTHQTKQGKEVLERLGVKFTEFQNILGKQVERIRPIADIFEDLHRKGASLEDLQIIFSKIGGNAALMFSSNYDKLRELTGQNRASYGLSSELALVKQETTKGLWAQMTSQLSESFMKAYEILEPTIRSTLHTLIEKFKAPEFVKGLLSLGQALVDVTRLLGKIGSWFVSHYHWLEPILFTGYAASRLFKLAGALTNIGIAIGFIGKQSAATSSLGLIQHIAGLGGRMSFASKRAIVSTLQAAGISGRGAMREVLLGGAMGRQGMLKSLFATQVAVGNGITGAAASLSALGTGAVAATAGITALVAALGYAAYKTWKLKEAKDAVQEELGKKEKYHYPSIEALTDSLKKAYRQALDTKQAVDELNPKTLGEVTGQSTGFLSGRWWESFLNMLGSIQGRGPIDGSRIYTPYDAYQDDVREAIHTKARLDRIERINAAYAELGKRKTPLEVGAFIQNVKTLYGQPENSLDSTLWTTDSKGKVWYIPNFLEQDPLKATKTIDYAQFQNTVTVPDILRVANLYMKALSNQKSAQQFMKESGFDFDLLIQEGFYKNQQGYWQQKALGSKATNKERENQLAQRDRVKFTLSTFIGELRKKLGGSASMVENIIQAAGFTPELYANEPGRNDSPFNALRITSPDDGEAGGNYSGTGKLSSAAPRQVVVNISNLMSINTIDLMKSEAGKEAEIQNLKEQLANALIDVVHDFDASWNA